MMTAALSGARGGVCAFSPLMIRHFGAIDKGYVREDFAVCQTSLIEAAGPKPPNELIEDRTAAFGFASFADHRIQALLCAGRPTRSLLPALTPPETRGALPWRVDIVYDGAGAEEEQMTAASRSMVLEMIDWRSCPVIEYTPDRVSGAPCFLGMRMPVDILVSWIESGQSVEDFERSYRVGEQNIRTALDYLHNDPPMHIVDLTGCSAVEQGRDGWPAFKGTEFPVEIMFNHLKGGITPRAFSERYGLDYEQIERVLSGDLKLASAG